MIPYRDAGKEETHSGFWIQGFGIAEGAEKMEFAVVRSGLLVWIAKGDLWSRDCLWRS